MTNQILRFVSILIFFSFSISGFSQSKRIGLPFIKNFSPQEYGQHIQNWSIIQDERGMMYIGNGNGMMEYDGERFRLIELPNETTTRSVAIDKQNRIYVGSVGDFGYLEPDSIGRTKYISLVPEVKKEHQKFADVWDTKYNGNSVVFKTYNYIFRYKNGKITSWPSQKQFSGIFIIDSTYYVLDYKNGLYKISGDKLIKAPYSDLFKDRYFSNGSEFVDGKAIFPSSGYLYTYDPSAKNEKKAVQRFRTDIDDYLKEVEIYKIHKVSDNRFIIGTLANNGFIVIDSTGKKIQKINNDQGLQEGSIYAISTDKEGNAWLAMSNGVAKAEISSSITFWDHRIGLEGTVEDIIEFEGTLYVATHQGFYYLDDKGDVHPMGDFKQQCWDFLIFKDPDNPEKKRLLATGRDIIYEIKNNKLHNLWSISDESPAFYLYQSENNPELIYAGLLDGLAAIHYKNGQFVKENRVLSMREDVRSIEEDNKGNLWLGLFRKGAIKLKLNEEGTKAEKEILYNKDDGFRSTKNILIYPFKDRLIFASDKGFHKYNHEKDCFIPDSTFGESFGNGSRDVFSFQEQNDSTVWCCGLNNRTGKFGYGVSDNKGNYKWKFRQFGRIPEMMALALYIEDNGTAWLGGSEGLFCYTPTETTHGSQYPTLIREVVIGEDSVIFAGNTRKKRNGKIISVFKPEIEYKDEINYNNNTVTFNFAALSFEDLEGNKFSYYLEGFDNGWSEWTKNSFKQYNNLREGDYVFHVKSANIYGIEGDKMSYKFSIRPPWYRSTVAYISYFLLFGFLFYSGILINSRRLKKKNRKLEEIIRQRTNEITEQKEEIEQQNEELEQQRDSIANQAGQLRLINQELRKLTIVARETDNGILITDPDGNIEWINEGFVRLFGYNIEELREKLGMNIINSSSVPNMKEIFERVKKEKKSEVYESKVIAKNGEIVNAYTTLTPVLDENGEIEKVIAIDSDIRKLKEAEEELKMLNATKDKFFSIIAHDLKNPFSSVLGASEVLLKKFDKFEKEKILFFIENIKKVAKQGYDLLMNLLEWSRSQTGRLKFEMKKYDLYDLVESNIQLLQTSAGNKNIRIKNEVDPEVKIFADKNTVLTVLRNLISNAIKYTRENGKIYVKSESGKDDYVKIIVEDTGIGISEKIQKKLFRIDENFSKKGTNNETGTGLGLILCKEFVERNSGNIYIESEEGKGSKFIFTLLKK